MLIEKLPLQERIERLKEGLCAHQEYYAAEIYRFAEQPIITYFHNAPDDLATLERLTGISRTDIQDMTYMRLAHAIDDKLRSTPTCGDRDLHEAVEMLAVPMVRAYNGQPANSNGNDVPIPKRSNPKRISLDERLKDSTALESYVLLNMEVESFLLFMDDMVSCGGKHFENAYLNNFQEYGSQTIVSLIADSMQMPEAQREKIQYHLLVKPFAYLEEHPAQRYKP